MEHGVKEIIPVATVDEARALQAEGYLAAAERGGQIVEGFDLGNSPYSYMEPNMKGQTVVLTTTNGTKAINMAKNKETSGHRIAQQFGRPLRLVGGPGTRHPCARLRMEGQIQPGRHHLRWRHCRQMPGLWQVLRRRRQHGGGQFIFRSSRDNMFAFLKASSHRRRLRKLNLNEDVKYCLTPNNCTAIPILQNGSLVRMNHDTVEHSPA